MYDKQPKNPVIKISPKLTPVIATTTPSAPKSSSYFPSKKDKKH